MTDLQSRNDIGGFEPEYKDVSFPFPEPPATIEEERLLRKQRLAAGLRVLGRLRLAEGVAGHVTVRDPEHEDHFWVNPLGKNFKYMTVSDLICVDHEGRVVIGDRPVNKAAFAIHSGLHKARPDVMAAAHCHSMYGRTFSAMATPLRMFTQDDTQFYGDVALHATGGGAVVLDPDDGDKMAASLGDKKALIHQNHGLITVGTSVDAAIWWFVALERSCQTQLVALAAGDPVDIPDELAAIGHQQQGGEINGWFQFQPWMEELLREEPDFLT
ncbi:MAG: class II aldolase/adducin family protein [Actinomycetota bacterium]